MEARQEKPTIIPPWKPIKIVEVAVGVLEEAKRVNRLNPFSTQSPDDNPQTEL